MRAEAIPEIRSCFQVRLSFFLSFFLPFFLGGDMSGVSYCWHFHGSRVGVSAALGGRRVKPMGPWALREPEAYGLPVVPPAGLTLEKVMEKMAVDKTPGWLRVELFAGGSTATKPGFPSLRARVLGGSLQAETLTNPLRCWNAAPPNGQESAPGYLVACCNTPLQRFKWCVSQACQPPLLTTPT